MIDDLLPQLSRLHPFSHAAAAATATAFSFSSFLAAAYFCLTHFYFLFSIFPISSLVASLSYSLSLFVLPVPCLSLCCYSHSRFPFVFFLILRFIFWFHFPSNQFSSILYVLIIHCLGSCSAVICYLYIICYIYLFNEKYIPLIIII